MNIRQKRNLFLLVPLMLLYPVCLHAQDGGNTVSKAGTSVATFLEIPVGAQAVGMGCAFISRSTDATALYWNAAGLSALSQNQVVLSHTNWIADTRFDFAGLVLPLGDLGTVGLSVTSLTMEDMKVRTVDMPEGTGEFFSAGDLAAGISYARKLTDRFSIGFTAKYIRESIWHESAEAFALDAGTLFRTDLLGGIVVGASLSNFGTPMRLAGRDTRQFERIDPSKQGSNDQIPVNIEMDSWELPLLFQLGVSADVVKSESYRWTLAVDALHPSDDNESLNFGAEFAFRDYLFIRGGYNSLFLDQAEGGLALGAGIASRSLFGGLAVSVDYAFRDFGRLESIHVLTVGMQF
jgi:hypothetical protein